MPIKTLENAQAGPLRRTAIKPEARKTILLADDDAEMRSLLSLALMQEGYNVIECKDGQELSLCIRESTYRNTECVDVVVSDIRMPGLSGLAVLKVHGPGPRCPPIILMTAFGDHELRQQAIAMGAAGFLEKPFALDQLIDKIRELVRG